MAQEMNSSKIPTGRVYGGRPVKIKATVEPLDDLIQISQSMDKSTKMNFIFKYGNILDLLGVRVHSSALTELGQYWDVSMRCFTFPNFQLTPTIEEYGAILRMPYKKDSMVYKYESIPSSSQIAKLLDIDRDKVHLAGTGRIKGIKTITIEARLVELAKDGKWETFGRILALAIYGLVLFPCSVGIIDLGAISVFLQVEHYKINPIPAILAETLLSLHYCHTQGGGKIRGCLAVLQIWMLSHMDDVKRKSGYITDKHTNPLRDDRVLERIDKMSANGWGSFFSRQTEDSLRWKMDWWYEEEIIYCCGDFPNVPLMGPTGCINYNPALAMRQLAFRQKVTSEKEVQPMYVLYKDGDPLGLCKKVKEAWNQVKYGVYGETPEDGKVLGLGKRFIDTTPDYQGWIEERIKGANSAYASQDPLPNDDPQEMIKELGKKLDGCNEVISKQDREIRELRKDKAIQIQKIREAKEDYLRLQKENRQAKEENWRLQREIESLKRALQESETRQVKKIKDK